MKNKLQVAIDGPAGSGKGTLAHELARKLGAVHVYTGGMYRALALYCLRNDISIDDEEEVVKALGSIAIDQQANDDSSVRVFLNGEDITEEIASVKVSNAVPVVAKYPEVRQGMVRKQQEIAKNHRVVIEGRDIATVVLPNADLKIFLTAEATVRATRRFAQLHKTHPEITIDEIKNDLIERDRKDEQRSVSPLKPSVDSVIIDTSNDTIEDTVEKVMGELGKKNLS